MKTTIVDSQDPWRFLESLDARNPGDVELINQTRTTELEIVRNLVLSGRVTLLYAFSGNGKSSLLNAGIIPAFHRSGYAVFRTRPRPAVSIDNPSQAFKDSLLSEFWLPLKHRDDPLIAKAYALLPEVSTPVREVIEPLISRATDPVKRMNDKQEQDSSFVEHFTKLRELPLPQFVSQIQDWVGCDVPMLVILDQFEELFVHYYNTKKMEQFIAELGEVYAAKHSRVKFLFSMREDWVGSMVQFRHAIPEVFSSCYKLEPLRVSQALPALVNPPKRVQVNLQKDLPERILNDLSTFYSVLQKESFAQVHLTPSGEQDPYIELPAMQVLMEGLWKSCDLSGGVITRDAYAKLAPDGTKNPAEHVLQTYLNRCLDDLSANEPKETRELSKDLRVDLLYLLTDRSAHRRAVTNFSLLSEANQLWASNADVGGPRVLGLSDIDAALKPLMGARLVRIAKGLGGAVQYELAHDFVVRSAIALWNVLDRRRTAEAVRKAEQERQAKERLVFLSGFSKGITNLIVTFAVLSFLSVAYAPISWLMTGDAPSSLMYLIAPTALLLVSVYVRSKAGISLGLASLLGLAGIISTSIYYYFSYRWSLFLAVLVTVTVFLLPGVYSWRNFVLERRARRLEWAEISAAFFNLALIEFMFLLCWWILFQREFEILQNIASPFVGVFLVLPIWIVIQVTCLSLTKSSAGYLIHGLRRRSKDSRASRIWVREVISQGLLWGFAVLGWVLMFWLDDPTHTPDSEPSHWGTRVFVLLNLGFLLGAILFRFRRKKETGILDNWLGTSPAFTSEDEKLVETVSNSAKPSMPLTYDTSLR